MSDDTTTLEQLKKAAATFVQERDWQQFHSPKNLSMDIAIEAAEIMEKFMWIKDDDSLQHFEKIRSEVEDELSDTLLAILCFANTCNIDLTSAFSKKLEEIKKKYPIEKVKGRADKYTAYK